MSSNSGWDKEIKTRIGKANTVFGRLEEIWKSNSCSVDTKVRLYESIVLSTLLYGAETWPITVANGRRLEAAHHADDSGGYCMSHGGIKYQTR